MVECLTGDQGVVSLSLTGGTVCSVVSLSKSLYLLLNTGLTQEELSQHEGKIVDWNVKKQNKQSHSVLK